VVRSVSVVTGEPASTQVAVVEPSKHRRCPAEVVYVTPGEPRG
jgi:hypothetical protein